MPEELDAAADELYAGAREDFTARRKELSRQAKDAGNARLAARIDKLAKPTTSAWVANQLARDPSSDVDQVVSLGEALREAHANLAGAELRALTQQRTRLVNTLLKQAGRVTQLTESVTRELEDIFTTAITNPEVAKVLLAGRLTSAKDLEVGSWPATGAEPEAGLADALAASVAARPRKGRQRTDREKADLERQQAALRKELEDARAAVKEAEADRKEEERILEAAQQAADEATERVRKVYEELDAAESAEKDARRRVGSASRSVKDAERRAGQAWRSVQEVERKLAELGE
ncbi:hypothetical protein [Actinophytocola sp.]|uniref:hypothetical protein n=1 Tax=Actinophytocola sp. TaxID=1872138 RepID=UPI003899A558